MRLAFLAGASGDTPEGSCMEWYELADKSNSTVSSRLGMSLQIDEDSGFFHLFRDFGFCYRSINSPLFSLAQGEPGSGI